MKEIKITPPEGYEIDKEKSTFEKIIFKEIEKELPKRWEDIHLLHGYYVNSSSEIKLHTGNHSYLFHKNVFASKEQAEASIALAQLSQLREVYRQGWVPDWKKDIEKFVIDKSGNKLKVISYISYNSFLSFQSKEITQQFLDNFRDLIEQASPLLFD